jgi:hypothetical protein
MVRPARPSFERKTPSRAQNIHPTFWKQLHDDRLFGVRGDRWQALLTGPPRAISALGAISPQLSELALQPGATPLLVSAGNTLK